MWQGADTRWSRLGAMTGLACALGCGSAEVDSAGNRRGDNGVSVGTAGQGGETPSTTDRGPSQGFTDNPTEALPPPTLAPPPLRPEVCEVGRLVADPVVPEMMIVLDRSGSMGRDGRWRPSVNAVKSITRQFDQRIDFGLTMFPDPAAEPAPPPDPIAACENAPDPLLCLLDMAVAPGGGGGSCSPGTVQVPVMGQSATEIGNQLDATGPNGGTPTSETLQNLVGQYAQVISDPDMPPPPKYVLLVTDGQPTCPAGNGQNTTPADVNASNAAVDALAAVGVKTYVIGYDTSGPGNQQLAQVLDGFAQRGATGDQQHRPVEDEASLLAEFERITGAIASCNFTLDMAPDRPENVLVLLDGVQLNLGDPNGWLLNDRTVEVVGQACQTLQSEGVHTLDVTVQCAPVGPG